MANRLFWFGPNDQGKYNFSGTQGADGNSIRSVNRGGESPAVGYDNDLNICQIDDGDIDTNAFFQMVRGGGGVQVSQTVDAVAITANTALTAADWIIAVAVTGDTGGATFYINKNATGAANRLYGPFTVAEGRTFIAYFPEYLYEFNLYIEVTDGAIAAPSFAFAEDWA